MDQTEPGDAEQPTAAAREDRGVRTRLRHQWDHRLDPDERAAVTAWASFGVTFGIVRAITHGMRDGGSSSGGGLSVAGHHLHHFNLGILGLMGVGAVAIRGPERRRRHPLTAIVFGSSNALILDETALLIDLQDVYWAKQGRNSVDLAVGVIAAGAVGVIGSSFWMAAVREFRSRGR